MWVKNFHILIGTLFVCLLALSACVPGVINSNSNPGGFGQGQTEPKTAEGDNPPDMGGEGSQIEDPMTEPQPLSGKQTDYSDSTFKFRVSYPESYVFRSQPAEKMAKLEPKPDGWFTMIKPELAANQESGVEPADLEIRTYSAGQSGNLEAWLITAKLLATDGKAKPFTIGTLSGLEVCGSGMIFPSCSYFFIGNGWVYQMIPFTTEGQSIMRTFSLQ